MENKFQYYKYWLDSIASLHLSTCFIVFYNFNANNTKVRKVKLTFEIKGQVETKMREEQEAVR